ncbi:MAG: glutathione S-transferase [Nannocystis sp.]|nr:glutathione S-transferase [Nannocystis sp.]
MKLFYTPTSPFVRKVLVVAHELGISGEIELTFLRPTPTQVDPTLSPVNPLSKIPALVLEDGEVLYDSAVLCEFLDTRAGGRLIPRAGPQRWRTLRAQALCDGILEAGVAVFYERHLRPQELHWQPWLEGQLQKARGGLDALEEAAAGFDPLHVGLDQICAGVTVGWLELRGLLGDVRAGRPRLAAWYERFAARPSMVATAPPV